MSTASGVQSFLKPDPRRIVVPRKHGQILVEPAMGELIAAGRVFPEATEADFLGMPRWAVAETARGECLDAINQHARAIGEPELPRSAEELAWIITGHQVEFYHAGVWAKVLAADHVAGALKGLAIDLLVDHDVVDELGFDVPTQEAGGLWRREGVTWDEAQGRTADALRSPTVEQFEHWDSELGDLPSTHVDTLGHVLTELRPKGEGGDEAYAVWMSRARRRLEKAMGVEVSHVPTGLLCGGSTWLLFVLAWIRNAEAWTAAYNGQLAGYRTRAGIKSDMHPMPDVARRKEAGCWEIELPFWVYAAGESRSRLVVRVGEGRLEILYNGTVMELVGCEQPSAWESVQALKRTLRSYGVVVRPRALTLTMYVRLFLADLFIHGIGGALYDQITDGILLELFGIATPYACVSAAWLLRLGSGPADAMSVAELRHERHHMVHNPQRGIDPFTSLRTQIAELIKERRELIEGLAESVKRERVEGRGARAEMFKRLHAVNAALHAAVPKVLTRVDAELTAARGEAEQNKARLWREYYFGLHTMESLERLREGVGSVTRI